MSILRIVRRALGCVFDWAAHVLDLRLLFPLLTSRGKKPRILFGVHAFHPHVGGCEKQVQWMADALRRVGYECFVYAPRRWKEPRTVDGIPVVNSFWIARYCDVIFTYSANTVQQRLVEYARTLRVRPALLHFPCSMYPVGKELTLYADRVIAKTPKDIWITETVCGSTAKARALVHAAHESRRGKSGRFRAKYGIDGPFILWVGGWLPAKGVKSLCNRFIELRKRNQGRPVKLLMFGGYGESEFPLVHPDVVRFDKNSEDVPDALADCTFLAFNSPPAPIGYDANPTIFYEAFLNGKTFLAQAGTPILETISHLGLVVDTDAEWVTSAESLLFLENRRSQLEKVCTEAYDQQFNYSNMMRQVQDVIEEVNPRGMHGSQY